MTTTLSDDLTPLGELARRARRFVDERDWDQFHAPRNLAMGLTVEAAELAEIFLWKTDEASDSLSDEDRGRVRDEASDVLMYLLHLSNRMGFDLTAAFIDKLGRTEARYPVEKARGRSDKYTAYQTPDE